ncbi:MAG: hypothetical protein J0M15_12135 [Deltaproteobacteria bacterium]|nr:hypothetical protein [Deltaproteobacteria bacterium]
MIKPLLFIVLCLIVFLTSSPSEAQVESVPESKWLGLEIENTRTSDELNLNHFSFNYRKHRRNLFFPFANEKEKSEDVGVAMDYFEGQLSTLKFNSLRILGLLARKSSRNFLIETYLGGQYFKSEQTESSMATPGVSIYYQVPQKLLLQSHLDRFYLAQDGFLNGPLSDGTNAWRWNPSATYFLNERFRFLIRPELDFISDGNKRFYSDFALMYGISSWPRWIWVGLGAEYLSNSITGNYWSPSLFKSYGLRFELNSEISKGFSGIIGLNYNQIQEKENPWGSGHYLNLGLAYGDRNSSNLNFSYFHIQSVQSNNEWKSNTFALNWNYFF